uniref:Cytosolic arginine sensor for mTORC1 subunit 1 n=1 Tax=Equus asinus TaxID=9793 RepID=A0A9L0JEY4_EQUAS
MELHILEHRVRVLSLARPGLWLYTHPLIKLLFLPHRSRCKFFSLTETPEDYTLMVDEEGFKELPPSEFLQVAEATWLVLNVSSHSGAAVQAAGVTKIARSVIAPLAKHHVSVLMLSTYQTDFILVREQDLSKVIHTLAQEFDIYREVGGEPVPVARADSSNGFPRAQHGEGRPLTPKPGRGLLFPLRPFPCAGGSVGMGRPADTASQDGEMGRGKLPWVLVEHDPAFSPGPTRGRPSPLLPFHLPLPGPSLAGPSPTVHPIQSPQNRFCVLTLDPETLPAIATTLIDVLFYSHSAPKEAASGSPGPSSITFFAFSLIEGYISIVMDAETQKKFPSDLLLTSSSGELWRMVRIGGQPLGFDECGIVAQIAGPLAAADISAYYISTFNFDHALVPEDGIGSVIEVLQRRQEGLGS